MWWCGNSAAGKGDSMQRLLDKQSLEIRRLQGNFDRYRELETKFRKRAIKGNRNENLRKAAYYERLKAEAATSLVLDHGEIL